MVNLERISYIYSMSVVMLIESKESHYFSGGSMSIKKNEV